MTVTEPDTQGVEAALLVVDPDLAILSADRETTVVWHTKKTHRVSLRTATAGLWRAFAVPRTVRSVVEPLVADSPALRERLYASVAGLREQGLLVPYLPDGVTLPTGRGGMFNAPVLPLADALRGNASDLVFIGMPYDVGVTHHPGSRFAPNFLRRTSGALFQYRDTADGPPGAYDPVGGRQLLAGRRLADVGDISQVVHTRNGPSFAMLTQVVSATAAAGRLPVVIGGDHSITWPVVQGLTGHHKALGVLHIDAHTDYAEPRTDGWERDLHHGNVMNWVIGHDSVHRVVQYGIRQLEQPRCSPSDKRLVWPGTTAATATPQQLLAQLPEDIAYHVTIDVDGLDPSALGSTGTPLPGGFTHRELVALLGLLCRSRRIAGIDMVEVLPSASEVDGLVAADVLLRTVDAATGPRS
ncbi:arginase family protein [Streptomyces sp. AC512_CC834]|uniref:arginase family protein n=1 Tax=Streptomyces sp. AC512_CC834 TaxID=2823691 RepID=UPI001C25B949|nr:arginase family protein [Streptomyces sp. AC512_CC834]